MDRTQPSAAELAATLRALMDYVGGWDSAPDHPCGRGRDVLKRWDEGSTQHGQALEVMASDVEAMLGAAQGVARAPRDMPTRRMEAAAMVLYDRMAQRAPHTVAATRLYRAADRLQALLPGSIHLSAYFAGQELAELRQALLDVHPQPLPAGSYDPH